MKRWERIQTNHTIPKLSLRYFNQYYFNELPCKEAQEHGHQAHRCTQS